MNPYRPVLLACLLAAMAWSQAASAQRVYKYVDENGVVHYTDRRPADREPESVEQIRFRAETQRIATLRMEAGKDLRRAYGLNLIDGPVEVELRMRAQGELESTPPLPARRLLAPNREALLAEIRPRPQAGGGSFTLEMLAVPGDPDAQPEDVVYRLPLDVDRAHIGQGFNGTQTHTDEASRFAIDLSAEEGTPVLAARGGQVMQVEDDFEGAGLDRERFGARANHVRVLHPDGTMAVYAHLLAESVVVAPGQRISVGQHLGDSGNTGFSSGPHLHFAVQVNRGMKLVSIPFRLSDAEGREMEIPGAP